MQLFPCGRALCERKSATARNREQSVRILGSWNGKIRLSKTHIYTQWASHGPGIPYTLHTKLENGPNAFAQQWQERVCVLQYVHCVQKRFVHARTKAQAKLLRSHVCLWDIHRHTHTHSSNNSTAEKCCHSLTFISYFYLLERERLFGQYLFLLRVFFAFRRTISRCKFHFLLRVLA